MNSLNRLFSSYKTNFTKVKSIICKYSTNDTQYSTNDTQYLAKEAKYGAHNYKPLPVVLNRGLGVHLYDINNNKYLDFLSAYSAVNQGHCHPRLLNVLNNQSKKLTLTSRAFYNDKLGEYEEFMCKTFGFDKLLPMNTGVEAAETAVKLARKWGYEIKKVPENKAIILFPKDNFWGRSIAAISASTDPSSFENYGPFVPNFEKIEYNNILELENKLQSNPNIVAYMMEPILGEAGVIVPSNGYLENVRKLCTKYNVLLIFDEIQTGLGRTGEMLASDHENIKPDILILGKALSGGIMPVSAVLSNNEIMLTIKPGQHGSTYGGNPLGAALGIEAVKIIIDNELDHNSYNMGMIFRNELKNLKNPKIKDIRGKGLMNAIEFDNTIDTDLFCKNLMINGLLAKPTHGNIVRFSPPLIISMCQMEQGLNIIKKCLLNIKIEQK
jgi:ornithine--oxo-acid transaminase